MIHSLSQRDTREALVEAATWVVAERGALEATTREIYTRAGVKAPTLYHHFGDRRGLMDAVVARAFDRYLEQKRELAPTGEPAIDVRRGWDVHVAFAQAEPAIYELMFPPDRRKAPHTAREATAHLRAGFDELDRRGALRSGVTPEHATRALSSALHGVTAAICRESGNPNNPKLSQTVRDAIVDALLKPTPMEEP